MLYRFFVTVLINVYCVKCFGHLILYIRTRVSKISIFKLISQTKNIFMHKQWKINVLQSIKYKQLEVN